MISLLNGYAINIEYCPVSSCFSYYDSDFIRFLDYLLFFYYFHIVIRLVHHLFVQIACVILLLHTILPHDHNGVASAEDDNSEYQEVHNFLDWITLAFHADFGEGHLENFLSSELDLDEGNQDLTNGFLPLVPKFDLKFDGSPYVEGFSNFYADNFIIFSVPLLPNSHRGPPLG